MPSAAVLGPVVIPLVAAAGIAAFGLARIDLGRMAAAAGAWGSVFALFAVWLPVRSSLELTLGQLGFGSAFDLRIDGVTFAFGLIVAAPAAVLLTLQPRAWPEAALSMLALTAAMASLEAGGGVLTALAVVGAYLAPGGGHHHRDPLSSRVLPARSRVRAWRWTLPESAVQCRPRFDRHRSCIWGRRARASGDHSSRVFW